MTPTQRRSLASKKAAATRKRTTNVREHTIHRAVAEFLDLALPADAFWTTFPAGGGGAKRGAHLKARGLKPGFPDILVIYRGRAVLCELKGPKGKLSPDQRDCHVHLGEAGARVAMCRSVDELERYLRHYVGIPLKASVVGQAA